MSASLVGSEMCIRDSVQRIRLGLPYLIGAQPEGESVEPEGLSLIHIRRSRRYAVCRSRWSPYH
eukprot:937445-Alexandrium_andersonii.AAC.1